MRVKITGVIMAALLAGCLLSGCVESGKAKEARLQGVSQMKDKDYAGAVVSFDTALREADGVVNQFELDILKYRGEAEYGLKDYEASAHTYQILLEVDGEKPEYLYYRASALAMAKNPDEAVKEFEKAAELKDGARAETAGRSRAFAAIGEAYVSAGDFEGARRFYQKAIDGGEATAQIYNLLGLSMMGSERYDEAIKSFDSGIALGDSELQRILEYNKAAAFERKGDFKGALKLFQEYVANYGSTPELEKEIAFLESR